MSRMERFEWARRFARRSRPSRRKRSETLSRYRRLAAEPLEDRRMLAITVDTLVDELDGSIVDGDVSLRDAIALAPSGETIDFSVTGTLTLTLGELPINKSLTIAGPGADQLTIDASGNDPTPQDDQGDGSRVFNIDDGDDDTNIDVEMRGLRLTGGDTSGEGGAIRARENFTLSDSTVTGNTAVGKGGGVYVHSADGGTTAINGSTISENATTGDDGDGGGVFVGTIGGTTTISDSAITDNTTTGDYAGGGGFSSDDRGGTTTIVASNISGNTSEFVGGGIYTEGSLTLAESTVSENSAIGKWGYGGGILARFDVTVTGSTISGNTAGGFGNGGGIYANGNVTVDDSTISGNAANGVGGGISAGLVTVISSTISGNTADIFGGGISGSAVTIHDSTISGNSALTNNGGGIVSYQLLTVTDSTISGNSASRLGGGIFARTEATVTGSTISGNTSRHGGGVYGEDVTVSGSTISGNSSRDNGGGIYASDDLTVVGSTISGNFADFRGGGVVGGEGFTNIKNSIVAGNTAGFREPDLWQENGTLTVMHSLIAGDPVLGPLADNGGSTQTHALMIGSPAINAGDPAAMPGVDGVREFDQRGAPFGRVVDPAGGVDRIDIGAFEFQALPTHLTDLVVTTPVDDLNGDLSAGDLSLREAVGVADLLPGLNTITFDPSLAGVPLLLSEGQITIKDEVSITGLGADQTTIDAQANSRIFFVTEAAGPVTLTGITLTGGKAIGIGGAILSESTAPLSINSSTISGNSAEPNGFSGSSRGGGIAVSGSLTITKSTVSGNTAAKSEGAGRGDGGGISSRGVGELTILESTISGNIAFGEGGGILAFVPVTVIDSTITDNTAGERGGGGIAMIANPLTIAGSIVAGNTDKDSKGPDVRQANATLVVSHSLIGVNYGTNLVEAPVGSPDAEGNLIGGSTFGRIDPLLGSLANNGGPTETHALLVGSPAIDAGDPAFTPPPDFDQRGAPFERVAGGGTIDMGAFEFANAPPTVTFERSPRYQVEPGTSVTLTLGGHDNDEDGESIVDWEFFFNGEEQNVAELGELVLAAPDAAGNYPIRFRVQDDEGLWSAWAEDSLAVILPDSDPVPIDVDLRIVVEPTITGELGRVLGRPPSEDWIDEWQPFWAEIWLNSPIAGSVELDTATVGVDYKSEYFTAMAVDAGPSFSSALTSVIDDAAGRVEISLGTGSGGVVVDGSHVLLARVLFEPTENDTGVPLRIFSSLRIAPVDEVWIGLSDDGGASIELTGGFFVTNVDLKGPPDTELWPVMYDLDDSGHIGFGDLAHFTAVFLSDANDSALAKKSDFDLSGRVSFSDLSFLAANFLKGRAARHSIVYPLNFPDDFRRDPPGGGGIVFSGSGTAGGTFSSGVSFSSGPFSPVIWITQEDVALSDRGFSSVGASSVGHLSSLGDSFVDLALTDTDDDVDGLAEDRFTDGFVSSEIGLVWDEALLAVVAGGETAG